MATSEKWRRGKFQENRGLAELSSWRRIWEPTPVLWPGESHGQRSLVSTVSQRVGLNWSDFAPTLVAPVVRIHMPEQEMWEARVWSLGREDSPGGTLSFSRWFDAQSLNFFTHLVYSNCAWGTLFQGHDRDMNELLSSCSGWVGAGRRKEHDIQQNKYWNKKRGENSTQK